MHFIHDVRLAAAAALLGLIAILVPAAAHAIDPSYSGSWYNPPESGSGFNLEIFSKERALLYWYTYDDAGEPVWLYSEGVLDGEAIDFDVYYSDGMHFSDLDTADKTNRRWGSLTMTFADCNHATISYASSLAGVAHSPVGTRTLPVQRLVNIDTLPCRNEVEGYFTGTQTDPTVAGGVADLEGVLTPDGQVYMRSVASDEVFLGTYTSTPHNHNAAFSLVTCADGTDACFASTGSATYRNRYYVRGSNTSSQYGTQNFYLTYHTVYDQERDLASLAGNYTLSADGVTYSVSIDAGGVLTGSDTRGCFYDGNLLTYDAMSKSNLFSYQGLLQGCTGSDVEEWTGVVVNLDDAPGDRRYLLFILDTGDGAVSFKLRR